MTMLKLVFGTIMIIIVMALGSYFVWRYLMEAHYGDMPDEGGDEPSD